MFKSAFDSLECDAPAPVYGGIGGGMGMPQHLMQQHQIGGFGGLDFLMGAGGMQPLQQHRPKVPLSIMDNYQSTINVLMALVRSDKRVAREMACLSYFLVDQNNLTYNRNTRTFIQVRKFLFIFFIDFLFPLFNFFIGRLSFNLIYYYYF